MTENRPVTSERMRHHNLTMVTKSVLLTPEVMSRADVAATCGMNRSTVSRLVDQLIAKGILVEHGVRNTGPGRPSVPLAPAPHTHVGIGAEISADAIAVTMVDLTGDILAQRYHPTPPQSRPDEILTLVADTCHEMATQARTTGLVPVGIVMGIPGLIAPDGGRILTAPNLGWNDVTLTHAAPSQTTDPSIPVRFDNSATLAATGEWVTRRRAGNHHTQFIYVTGSTGVGAATLRHDAPVRGDNGWGGEIGHVWAGDSQTTCSCGAHGCLETHVGRAALLRAIGLAPDAPIGHLLAALHRRETRAVRAVDDAGTTLGRSLAGYVNVIDSSHIVLGGLLGQLFDHLEPAITHELASRVLTAPWTRITTSRALVSEDAVGYGAAWTALLNHIDHPDSWQTPPAQSLAYVSVRDTPETQVE